MLCGEREGGREWRRGRGREGGREGGREKGEGRGKGKGREGEKGGEGSYIVCPFFDVVYKYAQRFDPAHQPLVSAGYQCVWRGVRF